jgi:hypothetical protein
VTLEHDSRVVRIGGRLGRMVVWTLPLLLPVLPAVVALSQAAPEESVSRDISWALWAIPVGALLGTLARAVQLVFDGVGWGFAVLTAAIMGAIGLGIGYVLWWQALVATCHGGYECPI